MFCNFGFFLRSFCTDCFLLANMRNAQIIALDVYAILPKGVIVEHL